MASVGGWIRNLMACIGVLALGYWFGSSRPVKAASADMAFQLVDVKETRSLLVYQPSTKTIYVYRGATAVSSTLQCSFQYVLDRPGGGVERVPCAVQKLLP